MIRVCISLLLLTFLGSTALADEPPAKRKTVYFLAGRDGIHAPEGHAYLAGCSILARSLAERMPIVETKLLLLADWPKDKASLGNAAALVIYTDGNNSHFAQDRADLLRQLTREGVGLVCIHWSVAFHNDGRAEQLQGWLGGRYRKETKAPNWVPRFGPLPDHPICRGIKPFALHDEWYHSLAFSEDARGRTTLLAAVPPERQDAAAPADSQTLAWAYERPAADGGGRSFGITGGHFHHNWMHDGFRNFVLNAIVWTAGVEVPREGVGSATPSLDQMTEHLKFRDQESQERYRKRLQDLQQQWQRGQKP